jgi:hypothetical protein
MRAANGPAPMAPDSDPLKGQLQMRPNLQDPTACLGFVDRPDEVPLLTSRKY